jgi:hypothetical protein
MPFHHLLSVFVWCCLLRGVAIEKEKAPFTGCLSTGHQPDAAKLIRLMAFSSQNPFTAKTCQEPINDKNKKSFLSR